MPCLFFCPFFLLSSLLLSQQRQFLEHYAFTVVLLGD
jgi:hypothetical protein